MTLRGRPDPGFLAGDAGLHALCHAIRDPVAVIALPTGAIVEVNAAFARLAGLKSPRPTDVLLSDCSASLARDVRAWDGEGSKEIARVRLSGPEGASTGRVRLMSLPGSYPPLAFLQFMPDGGAKDPLKLQRLLDERLEQLKNFERLRSLGEIAAVIVHELRTPLTSVRLLVDSVRRESPLDPHARRKLDTAFEQVDRLDRLLDGIRELARPHALKLRTVAVRDVLDLLKGAVLSAVSRPGLDCRVELADPSLAVYADAERLVEALQNLVINAAEAMTSGGRLGVSASTHPGRPGWVVFSVADQGPGILPEDLTRAFQPFFTTKRHGTGLGLAIVKKICDLHGGFVTLRSEAGGGTTATIELPPAPAKRT